MENNNYLARKETEINTDKNTLFYYTTEWLSKSIRSNNKSNFSTDKIGYISNIILKNFVDKETLPENLDIISKFISSKSSENSKREFLNNLGITGKGGALFYNNSLQLLNLLLLHLAHEGLIKLSFKHKIMLPQNGDQFNNYYKKGLISNIIYQLYAISTPSRFNKCKDDLPKNLKLIIEDFGDNIRSSRQRSIMNCMELVTYLNIKQLDSIKAEDLLHYFLINKNAKGSDLMYSTFIKILDKSFDLNLKIEWEKIKESIQNIIPSSSDNKIKIFDTKATVLALTCDYIDYKDVVVRIQSEELTLIKIGNDHIPITLNTSKFNPENIEDNNYWKKTQLDYLSKSQEKGTKKSKRSRLSLLNSYLFDYLPYFFIKNNKTKYKYPNSPSEFLSYIYVFRSETLLMYNYGENYNDIYPITILDYIHAIAEEKASQLGNPRTNSGRDAISEIQRYFKFIINKFNTIPQCKLDSNPISDDDKNFKSGFKYNKTVKNKIELNYWILFRLFLKEITVKLIENAENVIFKNGKNKSIFTINKKIKWLETEIHIDKVDLSFLGKFNFTDWKNPISVTNYQTVTGLYLMATSGLRASNIAWLDVNNYAQECPNEYDGNSFVELFVNTDKIQTSPFNCSIPGHVMKLLQRVEILRLNVDRYKFNKPIFYQGEPSSKWGKIKPLLQATKKNSIAIQDGTTLINIIDAFEKCIRNHNVNASEKNKYNFVSEGYYLPKRANQNTFRKTPNSVHGEQDYTATIEYKKDNYTVNFTPLKRAAKFTPHSLRVNFDSTCSVLTDLESVGKICTGQGAETVGYYSKNTLKELLEIKEIAKKLGFTGLFPDTITEQGKLKNIEIASVKDYIANEDNFKNNHQKDSSKDCLDYISLSAIKIHGMSSPIESLRQAPKEQIAFYRTHICPFDSICPNEVLQALQGEKCCAICPYAIISTQHAVGISAELKRLGDIAYDLTQQINDTNLLKREIEDIKKTRNIIIKSISGWLVRHNFLVNKINSKDYFIENKNNLQLHHISGSIAGKNILFRLKEVEDISTLQSPKLQREARHITRKLKMLLNTSPNDFNVDDESKNEISTALEMTKIICNLHGINEVDLVSQLDFPIENTPKWITKI
ncbi:hypothetical protein [Photobacterium leiognathi]|uniref:hypothetical protein n=1 Tax=Photobacterium leiognathi TaxID=553611 RepID=UPI0029827E6C|nr:hypothetical protein [Photobacterium leiognathi]